MKKRTTARGWDIYIDTYKEIVFISLNGQKITQESKKQLALDFKKLSDCKVIVVEDINNIEYADVEKLLEEIKTLKKDDENE